MNIGDKTTYAQRLDRIRDELEELRENIQHDGCYTNEVDVRVMRPLTKKTIPIPILLGAETVGHSWFEFHSPEDSETIDVGIGPGDEAAPTKGTWSERNLLHRTKAGYFDEHQEFFEQFPVTTFAMELSDCQLIDMIVHMLEVMTDKDRYYQVND